MREGAWINQRGGVYAWITEHASWIQNPGNARSLGMPESTISRLAKMPWDFNGPARKAILLEAMGHGFIRVRGHGADCTFEHTLPQEQAIRAALPFMADNFGHEMLVRFSNLESLETLEIRYAELLKAFHQPRVSTDEGPSCS